MSRLLSSLLFLALLLTAVVPASGVISSQLQNPTWETETRDDNAALDLPAGLDLRGVGLATKAARLAALKDKAENIVDAAETVIDVSTAVANGDTAALVEVVTDKALDRAMGGKKNAGNSPGPKSPKQSNAEADAAAKKTGWGNIKGCIAASLSEPANAPVVEQARL